MRFLCLTAVSMAALAATLTTTPTQAQSFRSSADDSPVWEVHLDLQKTFASPLGQQFLSLVEKRQPEKLEKLTKFAEAIGLDPRTELADDLAIDGHTTFGHQFLAFATAAVSSLCQKFLQTERRRRRSDFFSFSVSRRL